MEIVQTIKSCTDYSLGVSQNVVDIVDKSFNEKYDFKQLKVQIHPIISNAMYKRDKEIIMNERFNTLITLSKSLDNETLKKVIDSLGYKLEI